MTTADRKKWSVWFANVSFRDQPDISKSRPVIVFDDDAVYSLTCLYVTSQDKNKWPDYYYQIKDWKGAGLDRPSYVRLNGKLELVDSDFIGYLGQLQSADINGLSNALMRYSYSHYFK